MATSKPASPKRKKIVILGGGMASLAAAFKLTGEPGWQDKYEVCLYQMGWRLGGKGASGRNPEQHDRIEEHGLHIWPGFYDNAFGLVQQCYKELPPAERPFPTWEQAFQAQNCIGVEELINGRWRHWLFHAPKHPGTPGPRGGLPTPWGFIRLIVTAMERHFYGSVYGTKLTRDGMASVSSVEWDHAVKVMGKYRKSSLSPQPAMFLHHASQLARAIPEDSHEHFAADHVAILWFLDRFMDWLGEALRDRIGVDDVARRLWITLDLGATFVRGMLRDGVVFHGFDILDDEDYRAWLCRHGASSLTVDSALVRGVYDFIFACLKGDPKQPSLAAGAGLRLALRTFFNYKGHIMYKMRAPMGDVVFAPLYRVLKNRGVTFRFFHRVLNLGLSKNQQSIACIRLGRQATLLQPEYDPFIKVQGLRCWPSRPLYDQLKEGPDLQNQAINLESNWTPWKDVEEINLEAGKDFHQVVLGISLAALPALCAELIPAQKNWQDMIANLQTIQTQSLQLWLKPDLKHLGWTKPSPILTAYAEPLETWADMSQTLPWENWPADRQPGNAAYFCGPMPDAPVIPPPQQSDFPKEELDKVRQTVKDWLDRYIGHLWPKATTTENPDGLDYDLLVDQFCKANIDPTDRYVVSPAGNTKYRLRPDESGFRNLILAGDWTRNGLNVGCIEAAVQSGFLAARAISQNARDIPGDADF